jgi:hypothetical protein
MVGGYRHCPIISPRHCIITKIITKTFTLPTPICNSNPRTYFFTFPALPEELFRQEAPKKTNLVLPLLTLVSTAWQQRSKASAGTSRDDRVCRQKTAGE